eukprot:Gb_38780 [translate_table: standard]
MEESKKTLHDGNDSRNLLTFEIALVCTKRTDEHKECPQDTVGRLMKEIESIGLGLEIVHGLENNTFIKVAQPMEVLGRTAEKLQIRKPTYMGMDLHFDWEHVDAFVRQPDGSLFSWAERYHCLRHLIYGVVNKSGSLIKLTVVEESREIEWKCDESLLERLEAEGVVKEVFPLHDEKQRKELLKKWPLNLLDFTSQPIDAVYSYFGAKVATYFAFLGMYTFWLLFPAMLGIIFQFVDFGSWQIAMLPVFSTIVVSWAVLFLQFWKRKNAALLARWSVNYSTDLEPGSKLIASETDSIIQPHTEDGKIIGANNIPPVELRMTLQRDEWQQHFISFKNNAIVVSGIICLQLPFELLYAHLDHIIDSQILKYGLTAIYLLAIQYYTKIGGKISVRLVKTQHYESREARADSLVYKVFGLYFIQSYIGLFYHALFHRDITILRQFLLQRLMVTQVLSTLLQNLGPYVKYRITKHKAFHSRKSDKRASEEHVPKVQKEYMKPSYTASIGNGLEDGLFDDFLELALQFGMVTMFACAFPLVFVFALVNNLTGIRADSLKLLAMLRRPIPRAASTMSAWLNIFQFLGVVAICTNCALLVSLYDQEGRWKIEPELAAILLMEHILLLIKFGFSSFVPEEPAWVRANRVKHVRAQDICSRQLLQSFCKLEQKTD